MTGLVRKATLLAVCGLLVMAATALAGVPSPGNSSKPLFIDVVGSTSNVPDSRGTFSITVRDLGNTPVQNSQVILDFGACTDMRLCQAQLDTTKTVSCPTVRGYTNTFGVITFTVIAGGRNTGVAAGPGANCINILADGVSLGHATCAVYDQNGILTNPGVEPTDMIAVLKDWGSGIYFGRSDLDHDTFVTPLDMKKILSCYGDGTSSTGCTTTYCP